MTYGLLTPTHIAIVLVLALLIFGAKRLPETGRALGRGMREFKEAISGRDDTSAPSQPPRLAAQFGDGDPTTNVPRELT